MQISLDELQKSIIKLQGLLNDRHPGLSAWNIALRNELKDVARFLLSEEIPKEWLELLLDGWKIIPTSCVCGGDYAWLKPGGEMFGCTCHTTPWVAEDTKTE